MKLLKYYQYIKESFKREDLEDYFIFLHDLDLEYNINMDSTSYLPGFSIYIKGKVKKEEIRDFYVNFGSIINWLKSEGYENNKNRSNITDETIIDFLSVSLEYPKYNQIKLYNTNKFYNQIHIIHGVEPGNFGDIVLDLYLYFNSPETKK